MAYSLLAHLYPRIKGSQEDVATYSLAYILEQSSLLNEVFTRLIGNKLGIEVNNGLTYRCQDADAFIAETCYINIVKKGKEGPRACWRENDG